VRVACLTENASVLRYLTDKGADLNLVVDYEECTPLQLVAQRGQLPIIKLLLELGADINGKHGKHGSTIHYALLSGDEAVARFVLDNGALVDDSSPSCSTLCKAIRFDLVDLVPLLLEKGADVNKEEGNWTPVTLAFSKKRKELVKLLMDHGATFTDAGPKVLLETVKSRPLAEIKELLDYGMDPNCHDNYETPIGVSFPCVIPDSFCWDI
jgi:ankyrin repeat protein